MKWVTRERPKTDRIACPWLIKNFIDPQAEFLYVPTEQVLEVAEREGAHSYDAPNAEYTHRDGLWVSPAAPAHVTPGPSARRTAQVHRGDQSQTRFS